MFALFFLHCIDIVLQPFRSEFQKLPELSLDKGYRRMSFNSKWSKKMVSLFPEIVQEFLSPLQS